MRARLAQLASEAEGSERWMEVLLSAPIGRHIARYRLETVQRYGARIRSVDPSPVDLSILQEMRASDPITHQHILSLLLLLSLLPLPQELSIIRAWDWKHGEYEGIFCHRIISTKGTQLNPGV
jgi:hypothetical protein